MQTKQAHGRQRRLAAAVLGCLVWAAAIHMASAEQIGAGDVYSVIDVALSGPGQEAKDTPARDIQLQATFRHKRHAHAYGARLLGWRRPRRRCWPRLQSPLLPDEAGPLDVGSRRVERADWLNGQRQGDHITATPSSSRGFWESRRRQPGPPLVSPLRRLAPVHCRQHAVQFPFGLGENGPDRREISRRTSRPTPSSSRSCVSACIGDRYPNPTEKPFLDDAGAADRCRRLLASAQPEVVPRAGRRCRAGGV